VKVHCLTALVFTLVGCAGDSAPPTEETEVASGFEDDATQSGTSGGTMSSTNTTPADASDSDSQSQGPGSDPDTGDPSGNYETLGDGPLRGLLAFTYFAPDALNDDAVLGMAGAWRDESVGFDDVYDFFAVYGLDINFPAPPQDEDTLEQHGIPAGFEWDAPGDWLLAGNAMKLRLDDGAAHACLLFRGGSAEVEFPPSSGTFVPNYPMYAATASPNSPDDCLPDPGAWIPDTDYDIVLYGGDLFETNSLVAQVHTPPALEVESPDLTEFQLQIDMTEDLEIAWTGEPLEHTRLIIRVFDVFGRMFSVHATDDGSYVIPAADLAQLSPGVGTIIVSRENREEVPFTDGLVNVVSRYEQWGYVDFF
jgi:hypothetical protein